MTARVKREDAALSGARDQNSGLLRVGHFLVMFLQEVVAEIPGKVSPDGVNVVGVVLRVIVLDKKGLPLDAVIMALARLNATGPCKGEGRSRFGAGGLDASEGLLRDFGAIAKYEFLYEAEKLVFLR